jgi:hypothetical protein
MAWPITAADVKKGLVDGGVYMQMLIPDPADIGEFVVLKGLIGQGVLPNTWRIYQNYEFSAYYEATSADIKFVMLINATTGIRRVWLTRKKYRLVVREEFNAEIQYLKGEITAKMGSGPEPYIGTNEFGPEPSKCQGCAYTSG